MIRIDEATLIHAPIERCFDLSRSVEVHLLANVHFGEQAITCFRSIKPCVTEMTDHYCIAARFRYLVPFVEAIFLRRYMLALLRERNAVIKQVAESSD